MKYPQTIYRPSLKNALKLFSIALCLSFSLVFANHSLAQPIKPKADTTKTSSKKVQAKLDTTSIRYGEEIKYTISVSLDSVLPVVFPEGQTFSPLETIRFYPIDTITKNRMYELRRTYGITSFDSGSFTLPNQFVLINDEPIATPSFEVRVNQVVVDTLAQPMYTIKPFLPAKNIAFPWKTLLLWVLGIGIIAFILWYLLVRKKGIRNSKNKILLPLEEAIQAFKELDQADYLMQNNSKGYYSQLTNIVKRYLDRKVTDDALESTSNELILRLSALKDSGKVPFKGQLLRDLQKVLNRADLIKFANAKHEEEYIDQDRVFMESMVVETEKIIPKEQEDTEEALLFKQEQERIANLKRKRKNWAIGFASLVVVLGLGYGVYSYTSTAQPATEIDETNWISSAYGYPPLLIKTPEVLIRNSEIVFQAPGTKEVATFSSGKIYDPLYVMVESLTKDTEQPPAVQEILEQTLIRIEQDGAENLLVDLQGFTLEDKAEGIKAQGRFSIANKSKSKVTRNYELYLIDQASAVYQVLVVYKDADADLEKVKEHIIQSIEFQVSN